jgi:serine phosphatase RsbU (regulator of sigma subunit)
VRQRTRDDGRMGVRWLLFFVIGACAVVPVAVLGFEEAGRWAESERIASDRQALAAARAAADQLSFAMQAYVHAAESFSAQIGMSGRLDPPALATAMMAHMRHHPQFFGCYVADASGLSLARVQAGAVGPGGIDYSDREYFRAVAATAQPAISKVDVGRVTQVLAVQVAAPILDAAGEFRGITCSSVDLGAITERAKDTVRTMADGRVLVIDGEGHTIADSALPALREPRDVSGVALLGPPGSAEPELRAGRDDGGREVRGYVVGLKPPVSSWRVLALTPRAAIDAQARRVTLQTSLLVLAVGLAALLVAFALAGWLARPLRALARSALSVSNGDFDALPVVPTGAPREMAQLTRAVSRMIQRLRRHALDLEQVVAVRTAELSQANTEISRALDTIRRHERSRTADLEKARLFQVKLLPSLPPRAQFSIAAHYAPLEQVGGDLYDVLPLGSDALRIFLADATGHGVQASMRTLILKGAYDRLKADAASPSALLTTLNRHLVDEFPDGDLHCTACCVDIVRGPKGARVRYANAGNVPLYVLAPGASPREVYTDGPLLGVDHVAWPEPLEFELGPSELLMIASDGLIEQADAARERFDGRLASLQLGRPENAPEALARLLHEFDTFRADQPVRDDVTVVVVRAA